MAAIRAVYANEQLGSFDGQCFDVASRWRKVLRFEIGFG